MMIKSVQLSRQQNSRGGKEGRGERKKRGVG